MRIAVVSDTHSRSATIVKALSEIAIRKVEAIVHCGDIEDPDAVGLFPSGTHFVFGNCDTDREGIRAAAAAAGAILHDPFGTLEWGGATLAFLHGHDHVLLRDLEASGAFDYLFHGHTHIPAQRRAGRTLVVNPGALHRANPKQFLILDLTTGQQETVIVE
jgi:putative phosphoesterase